MAKGEFWKGRELTVPLSDELRHELLARSKDTLVQRLDREYENVLHREALLAEQEEREAANDAELEADDVDPSEEDDETEVVEVPYDKWTRAELHAEINDRNEARKAENPDAELLDNSGTAKKDLIAVLEADDSEDASE